MEQKKPIKVSCGTVIAIFIIIALLAVIGIMYYYNNERKISDGRKISELENSSNNLQSQVENLQNTIDGVSNVIGSNNKTTENTSNLSETDISKIKQTISNYYELFSYRDIPITLLEKIGMQPQSVQNPTYAPKNYFEYPNNEYMWTGIKYSDFTNNIWYVSQDVIKKEFNKFEEYNEYLFVNESYAEPYNYEIINMNIQEYVSNNECVYSVKVKNNDTNETFTDIITLSRGNGDFIISSVE